MRTRKKPKDILKQMKIGHNNSKSVGHWESNPKREIHTIATYFKKRKKKKKKKKKFK